VKIINILNTANGNTNNKNIFLNSVIVYIKF